MNKEGAKKAVIEKQTTSFKSLQLQVVLFLPEAEGYCSCKEFWKKALAERAIVKLEALQ